MEDFRKELIHLVKIGMLTIVQQSQQCTPIFIIAKKELIARFINGLFQSYIEID